MENKILYQLPKYFICLSDFSINPIKNFKLYDVPDCSLQTTTFCMLSPFHIYFKD